MRAARVIGVWMAIAALPACDDSTTREPIAKKSQALTNLCRLPTVGAACDPDGDGPATACDGICVVDGTKDNGADCVPVPSNTLEGMPCGGLDENKVECVRSCRRGVCTTTVADDETPCMPSGSPYYSAVCEGACRAGSCVKLAKPKNCPVVGADGGVSADAGTTSDTGSTGGGYDTGTSGSDDTGTSGGDDTGSSGSGDDTGAASGGDDTGASGGDDTGASGGDDTGALDDTGASAGDDTGALDDTDPVTEDSGTTDDTGAIAEDTGAGGGGGGFTLVPPKLVPTISNTVDTGLVGPTADPVPAADANAGDTGGCGCQTPASSSRSSSMASIVAILIALRLRKRSN